MQVTTQAMMQFLQTALQGNQPEIAPTHSEAQSRVVSRPLPPPLVPAPALALTDVERLMFFRNFMRSKPTSYNGAINGIVAKELVKQFGKLFDATCVLDNGERVRLATLCFTDLAET